jgi:hypothetical protein
MRLSHCPACGSCNPHPAEQIAYRRAVRSLGIGVGLMAAIAVSIARMPDPVELIVLLQDAAQGFTRPS